VSASDIRVCHNVRDHPRIKVIKGKTDTKMGKGLAHPDLEFAVGCGGGTAVSPIGWEADIKAPFQSAE
jgi:hypothetical protein